MPHMPGIVRLIHPAPALTVVALSAALGAIVAAQAGLQPISIRWGLISLAVAGSQILTGALNDWADRDRDAVVQPAKPIPSGAVTPRAAVLVAAFGVILQVTASAPLGWVTLALGSVASASAVSYDLWLSRSHPLKPTESLDGLGEASLSGVLLAVFQNFRGFRRRILDGRI
jgi:4-hydroxybenzoate polyprenyltransferase